MKAIDLRKALERYQVPDDAEIWIEYPAAYGLAQPQTIIHYPNDCGIEGVNDDFIQCGTFGYDKEHKRFICFHHY
jgi:hypothetical protein